MAIACILCRHDTVLYLAEELGADVNRTNTNGSTPLLHAASKGHLDVVRLLLKLRADINHKDNVEGTMPLMTALYTKEQEVVKWLVKLSADTNLTDKSGITPLMVAIHEKQHEVVKWLVKAGADTQMCFNDISDGTAASLSRNVGASAEQTAYPEAKTLCIPAAAVLAS